MPIRKIDKLCYNNIMLFGLYNCVCARQLTQVSMHGSAHDTTLSILLLSSSLLAHVSTKASDKVDEKNVILSTFYFIYFRVEKAD